MIILMIAIGILLVAVGIIIDIKTDSLEMGVIISVIGGAHAILWILPCIFVGIAISSGTTLEEKISLMEAENSNIDTQICEIVEGYKDFEKSTLEGVSNKSANVLIRLYPELKSDELVAKQMDIYMDNKSNIVSLKKELIDQRPLKWWLYFGG